MFLSIVTLNNYDDSIWDGFELPIGLDKNEAVFDICTQCSDLALLYPDFDLMKKAISSWSKRNAVIWQKLYDTVTVEYNPLWNVDAVITETNSGTNDTTNTDSVKGYNDTSWADHAKNVVDNDWSEGKSMRRTGNIGVTSSQKLLTEEREVALFDIYRTITKSFMKEFCLMIY